MLLTLTPNPSLDLLFEADCLVWDDANRLDAPRRRAGGQGINVVRAARALGVDARAVAPLGGQVGGELAAMLAAEGTPLRAVWIAGETRVFVGVREGASGRSLLLNPRGPRLGPAEAEALCEAVRAGLDEMRPRWVACCGSLPPGLPPDLYAAVGRMAREAGARFVPDCDTPPLRLAVDAGCDLLVPNRHEAGRLLGEELEEGDVAAAARAATALLACGPAAVAVTMGAAGAVLATRRGTWHAAAPPIRDGSAVGAGDAFLAGLLAAMEEGAEPPEALRAAVAAGTATLLSDGQDLLRRSDYEALLRTITVRRAG
ncbi:MAG: hexose kinase [bacterium]|nr:MAG: 1-phosphofructokinase [bacterium]